MKDLKHIHFYEDLLEQTANELVLQEGYGIPTLGIDREYVVRGSGQLATRMQAFVESLEIKKRRKVKKKKGAADNMKRDSRL